MKGFKSYQHLRILTSQGTIANGDYILDGITVRISKGFLNDAVDEQGNVLPAVESNDGNHIEHWRHGVLHCENLPAIVDNIEGVEEWYLNGKKVPSGGEND